MSFPHYDRYKDSGVEWLGKVPEGWEVTRIKDTTYLKGRVGWKGLTSDEYLEGGHAYLVTGTDFSSKFIDWKSCHCVDSVRYEDDPFIQLRDGDLLITKDGTIGKLALVSKLDKPACLNSGIFLVRPISSYITAYLYWILSSTVFSVFCDLTSLGSTIQHLYQNVFERFAFPVPPLSEQQTIAAFLDRETGKIDELALEQERLIELLKEKRQAVISHAVTKGLNPDAPMKDSGIEWLGEVPAGWIQTPIKHTLYGLIDTEHKTAPFYDDGEYLVVRTTNIKDGKLLLDGAKYTDLEGYADWTRRGKPEPGDIMFTREAPAGEACLVPENISLCMGQRTVLMRVNHDLLDSNYGLWSIYGGVSSEFVTQLSQGSTVAHFNMSDIGNIPLLLPPKSEQAIIAAFLDSETAKIDALVGEAQKAISLLKERRSALISAAVTGKIDLRGFAGNVPC